MRGLLRHPLPARQEPPPAGGRHGGLEVQIHPADIRRRVRYLFLSRRQVVAAGVATLAFAAFLVTGLVLAPQVVRGLLGAREYAALEAERAQQGRRLQALGGRLEQLSGRTKRLRLEMQKMLLAYGLSDEESIGQGGYPFETGQPPASIYAGDIARGDQLRSEVGERLQVLDTFLAELEEFEGAYSDQVRETPSIKPLPAETFVLTSPFGERTSPFTQKGELHAGVDLAALEGTPVHATADGVVVFAGLYPRKRSIGWWRYGKLVVMRHGDSFITLFGHLSSIAVRQGQQVARGEVVGAVGSTGWSTNPHLHYEVRRRAGEGAYRPVDPRIYILDHRWDNQERLLIRARNTPPLSDYEPLPRLMTR